MEGLRPDQLNKSFSVKLRSGPRAHKYTLTLGSMGISLLDGHKPYKSFIYANLVSWDATTTGLTLTVGVERKKAEFATSEGEEIAELITIHAREIAEQYLADQRREEEEQRKEQERQHERLRQQHRELESQHEQQQRERQDKGRSSDTGSPEKEFRPPPVNQSSASVRPQPSRRSSLDSELDRIQHDAHDTLGSATTEQADVDGGASSDVRIRQERAQQLAEEAMELMQHANRPDDYRPALTKCESALALDPNNQLAKGMLEHVNHVLKGDDAEGAAPKARFAALKSMKKAAGTAGSQLHRVAPKGMMQGMKLNAAKTGKNVGEWVKHRNDNEQTGPRGFHPIGLVKIHAFSGLQMVGSKGFSICAFLGSHSVHSSYAREKAEDGNPQWDEALLPISVEEVTDTLQIVVYRADLHKYGHVADESLKNKLQKDKIIGQVLIPLAHLYPLRRGRSLLQGQQHIKIRSSEREFQVDPSTTGDEKKAPGEGESEQFEQRTALHKGSGRITGSEQAQQAPRHGRRVLGRGRRSRSKQQEEVIDESTTGSHGGDSGLRAGGISVKEMEKWKHAFSEEEYQREKQQTKEKRTRNLAANKNDDLFRNMVGQQQGRPPADEDDDARSGTMSVKSAPGGLGGSRMRQSRGQGVASRPVSGQGSDEDESLDSGTSMPVSAPSSGLLAGGRAGDIRVGSGRAVHFAATQDSNSEASFASSDDTGDTGGSESTGGFRRRRRPESTDLPPNATEVDPKISPATKLLPEVPEGPSTLPALIDQGPGTWYEIFPYCSENSDGQYRTAVDELSGLAMSRPLPRMDLAGKRTLGYIRLKVELELLSNPYSCYLREPKRSFHNYDEDELSIPRLKHNWLRLKMVLMPSHVIRRIRDIAGWDSIPVSGAVLSFWAYLSLMAPFWQYPVFLVLFFGVASATGRSSDRLLEEVVAWEDMADEDPDPFTLKKLGKVKGILLTVQTVLGIVASFGERLHYIFSWTDPIVTSVAIFITVMIVVLTSMVCYGIYLLAIAIGGRPMWFSFGCLWMLPPRFAVIPWSKVDDWEDFLLEETETEQVLLARKKIRQKRYGRQADLQLEKRLVRRDKTGSKQASTPSGEPGTDSQPSSQGEQDQESKSNGGPDVLSAAASAVPSASAGGQVGDGGATAVDSLQGTAAAGVTGEQAGDPDVQAALKMFEKPDVNDAEPATNVVSMLGNLWARIPDVPVRCQPAC